MAALLAMDRTTLTAALKPLERRGLVKVSVDPGDRRSRLLKLTAKGRGLLARAVPIWEETHAALEKCLAKPDPQRLRRDLHVLSGSPATARANAVSREAQLLRRRRRRLLLRLHQSVGAHPLQIADDDPVASFTGPATTTRSP